MGELHIQIFDDQWPKLRLVGTIKLVNGQSAHFDEKVLYDQAYNKFEGTCHNMLRKVVEAAINRRKNPAQFLGTTPESTNQT